MADRTVRARFIAEVRDYVRGVERMRRETVAFGRAVTANSKEAHDALDRVGRSSLIAGGAIGAGLGFAVKAAIDWESAWAGVVKTVDGTEAQLASLHDGLREMATELPATHGEIAAVAEAAGALGVATPAIEGFTRVMIDLGESTNLTADQAATGLARVMNIMQTAPQDVERLGSALVHLGNNGASTEAEILDMALRIASAGQQIGLTEAEVLGFANALSSVGMEADAGGTAISRVMIEMRNAVLGGGDALDTFAATAGVSAAEFRAAFEEDAAGAIISFIEGLGRMEAAGQNSNAVLEELGLTDVRVGNALRAAAGAGDLFRESIETGNAAWEENTALAEEAARRYDTTAAKLEVFRNTVVDAAIEFGDTLLPVLTAGADVLGTLARGFGELPGPVKTAGVGIAGLSTAGLGLIGTVGILLPKIHEAQDALRGMGTVGTFVANNMGKMGAALGVAGLAVTGLSFVLGVNARKQAEAKQAAEQYTQAIREQGAAVGELTDQVGLQALVEGEVGRALRDAGADLEVFAQALRSAPDDADRLIEAMEDLEVAVGLGGLEHFVDQVEDSQIAGSELADELIRLAESGEITDGQMQTLVNRLRKQSEAYRDGAREAENLAAAEEAAGVAAEQAVPGQEELTESLAQQEEQAHKTREAVEEYVNAVRAQTDPLFGMVDALRSNRDAQLDYEQALRDAEQAQRDLTEAQRSGDPEKIAEAQRNLADAIRGVHDANFEVASSAVDVVTAQRELAAAIELGEVSLDSATEMLWHWVAAGLITADQARVVQDEFERVAAAAEEAEGEHVAKIIAETDAAQRAIDHLDARLEQLTRPRRVAITVFETRAAGGRGRAAFGLSTGGVVPELGFGPGDSVPALLTPGEFVIRREAAAALGLDLLWKLNHADRFAAGGPVAAGHAFAARRAAMLGHVSGTPVGQAIIAAGGDPTGNLERLLDLYDELVEKLGQATADQIIWSTNSLAGFELVAQGALDYREALLEAAEAEAEARAEQARREDIMFKVGAISRDEYLRILRERLAATEEFSDDWYAIWQDITRILDEAAREQQQILEDARRAFEAQVSELSDLYLRAKQEHERALADYQRAVSERQRRIVEETRRFRDDIVATFRDLVNPVDLFGGAQNVTAAGLEAALKHRVEAARRFAEIFPQLAARGIDQSILTDLAQRGPEALSLANALLEVDPELVNEALAATSQFGENVADVALGWERARIQQQVYAEVALPTVRSFNDLLAEQLARRNELAAAEVEAEAWARRMAFEVVPELASSYAEAAKAVERLNRALAASPLMAAPASGGSTTIAPVLHLTVAPRSEGGATRREVELMFEQFSRQLAAAQASGVR